MQVFSADGLLIGEYGAEKRTVVSYDSFPVKMREAILAAEDDEFFSHHGIDLPGWRGPSWPTSRAVAVARVPAPSPCSWRAPPS